MRAFLMFRDRDGEPKAELVPNAQTLVDDLGLFALLETMAGGDQLVFDAAEAALLTGIADRDDLLYRQAILRDCLNHPSVIHAIYATLTEAIQRDRGVFRTSSFNNANINLRSAVRRLDLYEPAMRHLRIIAEEALPDFESEGFRRLFRMIADELDEEYLDLVHDHLRRLKFKNGILISARLVDGNKGGEYLLRKDHHDKRCWLRRLTSRRGRTYTYQLAPLDQAGADAFKQLRICGIASVARVAGVAADHILDFLRTMHNELAFYVGGLNLAEALVTKGEPICFPVLSDPDDLALSATGLYDVCTSLATETRMVGNRLDADHRSLILITGANRGGKSTFLSSLGTAQLMMQCGLFVGAESFTASVREGVFTHYKREEDATLTSGKLDEELARMSALVDQLHPTSLVLFNESFAATNEREGSEIARQIIRALRDHGIRVAFVTHQYDLARGFLLHESDTTRFLRAERGADGSRPFTLVEAPPLPTSYGPDLYRRILGNVALARVADS
jgi:DNA mismatch repair ATPase MutS